MIFINSLINYEDPISKLLGSWSSEMNIWSIILKIASINTFSNNWL